MSKALQLLGCQQFIELVFSDNDVPGTMSGSWGPSDETMLPLSSQGPKDQYGRQKSEELI